ncbi:uncharacterized protein LOC111682437 isoform X1 [Lucilia cuprina]|uniref:uncharacterized protein LOC111682437 isoform X1 n=1 Tax=Lucilia cuprina TaxID=7375 RepID=UPI001F051F7F|nr:uncharacterized protein LOC111682437 isoform X1 [Lucilia cuprina]
MSTTQMEFPSFQANLLQPLQFGHILEICGKTQQDANRISINFGRNKISNNPFDDNDLDLQILLDFTQKLIIFTQFPSSDNNNIETKDLVLADFLNDFKFYIMLAETKFYIALNNKPFVNFKYNHNLAKLQIQAVEITGKLDYIKQLDHHNYFPHIWPPIQIIEDYLDFSNDQPIPFKPGHIMTISARLGGNNNGRFIIQFRHARDNKRQELHVSVRFDTKKIIRNCKSRKEDDKLIFDDKEVDGFTFLSSRYGQEEIDDSSPFPFADFSKPFKLAIAFCETEFRLAKDGQFLFNYKYRSPNILPFVMGPKIFGTNGVYVRVSAVEHLTLEDAQCKEFEKYSV